jgi:pyrroloquinoline quinone biosynthesis protein E
VRLPEVLASAWGLARARFGHGRLPLFASYAVTYRCDRACAYCHAQRNSGTELPTDAAMRLLSELRRLGLRRVGFTGGEPLRRDDLAAILRHCVALGLRTNLNTNGTLVPARREVLALVDGVAMSLDGGPGVHDRLRGKGSFAAVETAAALVRAGGKRLRLTMVLNRQNVDELGTFLELCRAWGAQASVHPVYTGNHLWPEADSPLTLPPHAHAAVFRELLRVKRGERELLTESRLALEHLARWPTPTAIPCFAGRLFVRVTPDGRLRACEWRQGDGARGEGVDASGGGAAHALARLEAGGCAQCWNPAVVDFNFAAAGRLGPALHVLRAAARRGAS